VTIHATIGLATPEDLPEIFALEQSTATAAHWSEEQYCKICHGNVQGRIMLVAKEERVLGFVVARLLESEWEIENVAVIAERQRSGLGRALAGELLNRSRLAGAGSVILEVRESNAAARALYENLGFLEEGCRNSYYSNPKEDAVLYRLRLW
jgi:ribosomal-protein-alanine acetyltransferase